VRLRRTLLELARATEVSLNLKSPKPEQNGRKRLVLMLRVRLFTFETNVLDSHAFLVGSKSGGLSGVLDVLKVNELTSFHRLRDMIEMSPGDGVSGGRRSILFREILFECENSSNPHGWTHIVRRSSYRLGLMRPDMTVPELIPLEEEESSVLECFRKQGLSLEDMEVIVVPLSQVGPGCMQFCNGCTKCTTARLPDSQAVAEYFHDGKVHQIAANMIHNIKRENNFISIG